MAWSSIQNEFINLMKLMDLPLVSVAGYLADTALGITIKICFALLVVSAVDYYFNFENTKRISV